MRSREPCNGASTVRMHSRMDLRGQTETGGQGSGLFGAVSMADTLNGLWQILRSRGDVTARYSRSVLH